jgi:hypothetical protein
MKRLLIVITILVTIVAHAQITPEQLYESASKNCFVVVNKSDNSFGTGFLLTNGYIVTNLHVVQGASPTEITLRPINNTNEIIACEKLYVSSRRDIAIIKPLGKMESSGLEIDTATPKIGSIVYVIGNSKGFTGTFSDGLVSQIQEGEGGDSWVQMSAPISSGNSGGPVMNKYGKVIGISTLSHRFGQNLNFAVPSKYIVDFLQINQLQLTISKNETQEQTEVSATKTPEAVNTNTIAELFTEEQLSLVEEVDDLYLKRNLLVFIPSLIVLISLVLLFIAYKKGVLRQWFDKSEEGSLSIILRMLTFFVLPIILIIPLLTIKNSGYPPFFKTKLEAANKMTHGDIHDHSFDQEISWGFESSKQDKIASENRKRKLYYSFILNETYNGSDAALLFLADGILTGELVQPADTTEALKWFKVIKDKEYFNGYFIYGLKQFYGWKTEYASDAQNILKTIYAYADGYANTLTGLVQDPKTSTAEKEYAKTVLEKIYNVAKKDANGKYTSAGYDKSTGRFIDPYGNEHSTATGISSFYNANYLYNNAKKWTGLSKGIATHDTYTYGVGKELKLAVIYKCLRLNPHYNEAKELFSKALKAKEVESKLNQDDFLNNKKLGKDTNLINYYVRTIDALIGIAKE